MDINTYIEWNHERLPLYGRDSFYKLSSRCSRFNSGIRVQTKVPEEQLSVLVQIWCCLHDITGFVSKTEPLQVHLTTAVLASTGETVNLRART